MTHNLVVSFDLRDPCRQSALIVNAIEELGQATRLFSSTWYVRSNLTAAEAACRVWDLMDRADSLVVVDASADEAAMFNVDGNSVQFMARRWHLEIDETSPLCSTRPSDPAPLQRSVHAAAG